MSREFAASRDINETLQRGLSQVAALVGAEAASLFLLDDATGELVCEACFGPVDIRGLRLPAGRGVVGRTVQRNAPTIVRDVRADPDFAVLVDQHTGFTTKTILCAPLSVQDHCLGAIELINKRDGEHFQPGDRQLLQALGASAALAIINARLTHALVAQERVRRELELAAEIQRGMLPSRMPDDFPIMGVNRPAHEVSGDFFDILPLPDGRIAFAVGDVSGKGINAALLMVWTSSLFRVLAKTVRRPGALLAAINEELCETATTGGMFVTMTAGVFDPVSGSVLIANAGHEPPLLHHLFDGSDCGGASVGGFTAVHASAPPLGIASGLVPSDMTEEWLALAGGNLYLFTDGLTESRSHDMMLGEQGVRKLLSEASSLPLAQRLDAVIARLTPEGVPLRDDLTLLVVEDRRPPPLLALRFKVSPDCLSSIRHKVQAAAQAAGCSEEAAAEVVLAVDEACQNIIRHAYGGSGEVVLDMRLSPEAPYGKAALVVQLIDFAPPVDVDKIKSRPLDELRPGGLGVYFMLSVMDEVGFVPPPEGAGNLLRMIKAIP